MKKIITVTQPLLPPLWKMTAMMWKIWHRRWITNNGPMHQQLEHELARHLGVPYVSLFSNGTLPLLTALQALGIRDGEVITTPYSFVATTHSIWWNGCTPVFVDVDPATGCMDPDRIEEAITPRTKAILPVHVYGYACDVKRIGEIARRHGLKVIYDAAHAFGVEMEETMMTDDGRKGQWQSLLNTGDLVTMSFHATKVYNTIEGGAMIMGSEEMKRSIDALKNFGITDEVTVVAPGINSKMDELRAAYGLLNLKQVNKGMARRKVVAARYDEALADVRGITLPCHQPGVRGNASYYPIRVDEARYGLSRDALYERMKAEGVWGRRYFYPLISDFEPYRSLPSAAHDKLPVATRWANEVICLPLHHALSGRDVERVIKAVKR